MQWSIWSNISESIVFSIFIQKLMQNSYIQKITLIPKPVSVFWRSYTPDYSLADPRWHTKAYTKKHQLTHPDYYLADFWAYYLRKCDFPYDMIWWQRIEIAEHWLLLNLYSPGRSISETRWLNEYITKLSRAGYLVYFNEESKKSVPGLWHGHVIRL